VPAVGRGALTPPSEVRFKMRGELRRQDPGVGIDTAEKLRTGLATMDVTNGMELRIRPLRRHSGRLSAFLSSL
jgi:hypothetical protein